MRQLILSLVLMFTWIVVSAQDSADVPNPPAIPTEEERERAEQAAREYQSGQASSSEEDQTAYGLKERKTIEGSTSVTEYSRGGHVYSMKIKPGQAPTQYVDAPGDGQLQPSTNEELPDSYNLPKWRLGHW